MGNIIRIPLWQLPLPTSLSHSLPLPRLMVTLDKGSPWHPLVVSIRGWTFLGRFAKGMDALAPMDFHLGGHQQLGFHLALQNPSLPGIIIPPGAQSNRHAKASSSSTAWLEETQVETPTVRITPLHRIIQEDSFTSPNHYISFLLSLTL